MAYTQLTTSPATVEFARELGGNELHIGILGALPVALVGMQLTAALLAGRFARRKPVWFRVSIVQRLVLLPAALGPWLWPELGNAFWIWLLIALAAVNHGLLHFGTPLWLSWMGDYLPHPGLNYFWGRRHFAQQWTAAAALLANALFFYHSGVNVRGGFAAIIALAAVLGVSDILLFIRVPEPEPRHVSDPRLWDVLGEPFRQADFRSFIRFSCFWQVAAMVGAPFISMYLLEHVGMRLFDVLLLWTISWVGGALLSNRLGLWAECFGQRPMLILCTMFKSLNMFALLFCPRDPQLAFWLLVPVFMIDALLNAGVLIATNGFLLKNSPAENRTMFIAAGTAFAGMAGGATSVLAGALLAASDGWSCDWLGLHWVNFHVLFAVSISLRLAAIALARRIHEPASTATREAARHIALELASAVLRFGAPRASLVDYADDAADAGQLAGEAGQPALLWVESDASPSPAASQHRPAA